MALILSLDSTTSVCSVAIHDNGILVGSQFNPDPRAAASQLGPMITRLFSETKLNISDLDAVAITSGPGSYTGLRIATSTAKGICYARNIPLIAESSLLVLTAQLNLKVEADLFCPMLDARRMEVYTALVNKNLDFISPVEAKVLSSESFNMDLTKSKIAFFGDGSDKFRLLVNHPNAIFVESAQPRAEDLGLMASQRFEAQDFESVELFEPFYLKDFLVKKKA